jgi:hypothetical protein
MEKKDCLVAAFDLCSGRNYSQEVLREVLRQARIKARKLVLVSKCGGVIDAFPAVRYIAAENMDFPVRHYHQTEVDKAVALEKCTTFEIINL